MIYKMEYIISNVVATMGPWLQIHKKDKDMMNFNVLH